MILPIMSKLSKYNIILASGSPRRKEILQNIGLEVDVVPSKFKENLNVNEFAMKYEYAVATAKKKVAEVANRLQIQKDMIIIGADTIVVLDEDVLGKPKNEKDAIAMLERLSGRKHTVITGVALFLPSLGDSGTDTVQTFYEETEVSVAHLDPDIINAYVATGEPMDKAGAYGIQGVGGTLVKGIQDTGFPQYLEFLESWKIQGR